MKRLQGKEAAAAGYKKRTQISNAIIFCCLALVGLLFILPFVWMTVVSFERYANVQPPFPPSFIVKNPSWFNFKIITENGALLKAYRNSLVIAVFSVAVNMVAVMLGGYALAKGRFRGKNLIFTIILCTMMIPFETRMIPMFKMFANLGLTNNFLPRTFSVSCPTAWARRRGLTAPAPCGCLPRCICHCQRPLWPPLPS